MRRRIKFLMRISLRTFLISCVALAVIFAWLTNEHDAYKSERALINDWAGNTPKGALTVVTNGESRFRVGGVFM